jgi:hypothetical protein
MAGVSPVMMAGMGAGLATGAQTVGRTSDPTNADRGAAETYQDRIDELNAQVDAEARNRQSTFDRLNARQRARFAAQGISPTEGSSAAVLDGLKSMSQAEADDRERQIEIARRRAESSYANAIGADLLTKKSSLVQDNLGKLLSW